MSAAPYPRSRVSGQGFTARLGSGGSPVATRLSVATQLEYSHENAADWLGAV